VITCGHHIDAKIEKLLCQSRSDAESGGSILTVRNDEIDGVLLAYLGEAVFDDISSRTREDVSNKKNFQNKLSRFISSLGLIIVSDQRDHVLWGSARLKAADEDARWTAAETVALRVSTIDVSTWKIRD
jgi:hypothetical protein